MNSKVRESYRPATLFGLAIALFVTPVFLATYRGFIGENHSNWQVLEKELIIFLFAGLLLWIVKRWERLPLNSIDLSFAAPRRSIMRGLGLAAVVLVVTVGLYLSLRVAGIRLGEDRANAFRPSLWVVTVSMLRAGIAEEIFYRGFAIERLRTLTGSQLFAGLVPLAIFAASHYRQGLGGVLAALILGGLFTAFLLKYHDLLANIVAHFLADFVLNVGLPLVSGS